MKRIGHQNLTAKIYKLVAEGRFPQTSLWYGQSGMGKKMLAQDLAKHLLCMESSEKYFSERKGKAGGSIYPGSPLGEQGVSKQDPLLRSSFSEENMGCGTCSSCQIFVSGNHPDFFLIEPTLPQSAAKKSSAAPQGSIKTAQIQELKKRLQFPPLTSQFQVVIVNDAELMTTVTANSLLKILEEPRPQQIFILVTSQLPKILVTIRSRAQKFYFPPLTTTEVQSVLEQEEEGRAVLQNQELFDFYLKCFPGAPALILQALQMPLSFADLERLLNPNQNFVQISETAKGLLQKDLNLSLFLQCLRTYALLRFASQPDLNTGIFDKITAAENQLRRHISAEFVLENLFL